MDSTADVGRYTCIAYNEVGQSSEIEFTVGLGEGPTPSMYDLQSSSFIRWHQFSCFLQNALIRGFLNSSFRMLQATIISSDRKLLA
jgi:hypothetical protein